MENDDTSSVARDLGPKLLFIHPKSVIRMLTPYPIDTTSRTLWGSGSGVHMVFVSPRVSLRCHKHGDFFFSSYISGKLLISSENQLLIPSLGIHQSVLKTPCRKITFRKNSIFILVVYPSSVCYKDLIDLTVECKKYCIVFFLLVFRSLPTCVSLGDHFSTPLLGCSFGSHTTARHWGFLKFLTGSLIGKNLLFEFW